MFVLWTLILVFALLYWIIGWFVCFLCPEVCYYWLDLSLVGPFV